MHKKVDLLDTSPSLNTALLAKGSMITMLSSILSRALALQDGYLSTMALMEWAR